MSSFFLRDISPSALTIRVQGLQQTTSGRRARLQEPDMFSAERPCQNDPLTTISTAQDGRYEVYLLWSRSASAISASM
jgi:hypothetical protein